MFRPSDPMFPPRPFPFSHPSPIAPLSARVASSGTDRIIGEDKDAIVVLKSAEEDFEVDIISDIEKWAFRG